MTEYRPMLWDKSFETGIDEIDEQHRILVNTINEADVTLSDDSSVEILEQITNDLLSYALYHFETEEEMMAQYGYDVESQEESQMHLNQHRKFSATVVEVRDNMKSGKPITKNELLSFLKDWLTNHILHTDKKLGEFLLSKKI